MEFTRKYTVPRRTFEKYMHGAVVGVSATLAVTLNDTATDVVVVADDGDTVGVCASHDAWKKRDAVTVVLESPMASAVTPRYSTKDLAVTSGNDSDGVYVKHSRIVCHKHEVKYKGTGSAATHTAGLPQRPAWCHGRTTAGAHSSAFPHALTCASVAEIPAGFATDT